ncbi:MAG TPA: zf-HC2 domain-containing protein [Gemmatimonadaceae bacterium]|nr:zf-HC2 domain-containing protein [Gemmatimonadaceae bacterium]
MTDDLMTMPDLGGLSCKEMVELVTDYLDGALPGDMRTRFERHLKGCPPCVVYVEQMRQTIATIGKLPEESIEPTALDALREHFRRWRAEPEQ